MIKTDVIFVEVSRLLFHKGELFVFKAVLRGPASPYV